MMLGRNGLTPHEALMKKELKVSVFSDSFLSSPWADK
jgi:hypothetical protein